MTPYERKLPTYRDDLRPVQNGRRRHPRTCHDVTHWDVRDERELRDGRERPRWNTKAETLPIPMKPHFAEANHRTREKSRQPKKRCEKVSFVVARSLVLGGTKLQTKKCGEFYAYFQESGTCSNNSKHDTIINKQMMKNRNVDFKRKLTRKRPRTWAMWKRLMKLVICLPTKRSEQNYKTLLVYTSDDANDGRIASNKKCVWTHPKSSRQQVLAMSGSNIRGLCFVMQFLNLNYTSNSSHSKLSHLICLIDFHKLELHVNFTMGHMNI